MRRKSPPSMARWVRKICISSPLSAPSNNQKGWNKTTKGISTKAKKKAPNFSRMPAKTKKPPTIKSTSTEMSKNGLHIVKEQRHCSAISEKWRVDCHSQRTTTRSFSAACQWSKICNAATKKGRLKNNLATPDRNDRNIQRLVSQISPYSTRAKG